MPHLTVTAYENELQGNEDDLIAALTDAVTDVYGEWAREHVVVLLNGIPAGRWGVGGKMAEFTAPMVQFGLREEVFARPDADQIGPALIAGVTDAITTVFGEGVRDDVLVELIGTPASRAGLGGVPVPR